MNQNLIGFAVGPLVVGAVSDAYGLKAALTVIRVFCAFAAFFFWLASRHYDGDLRMVAAATDGTVDNKCAPSASAALPPRGSTR